MTLTFMNPRSFTTAMARAVIGAAVLVGATSPAFGQARTLEGVWGIVTQDRNCATNAPQGPPTRALVTYHAGGTLDESRFIPVFASGQLSESHGTWSHDGGLTYTGRVLNLVTFDTEDPDRGWGELALGSVFTLRGGHSGFLEYRQRFAHDFLQERIFAVGWRIELP